MLSIYSDEYQKTVLSGQHPPDFIVFILFCCFCNNHNCMRIHWEECNRKCAASVSPSAPCTQKYPHIHYSAVISVLLCTVCACRYDVTVKSTTVLLSRCCRPHWWGSGVYRDDSCLSFSGQCRDSGIHGDFLANTPPRSPVTGWHCCCSYYAQ